MKNHLRILLIALLTLLILAAILHVAACVLYDSPVVLTLTAGPVSDSIEAFLNQRIRFLNADFKYIGSSTHDPHAPDVPATLLWYTSHLPGYASLGTDASMLCLVGCDSSQTVVDSVTVYIGSDKAIDSATRRYADSFHPVDEHSHPEYECQTGEHPL